jgi:hypothetical protein
MESDEKPRVREPIRALGIAAARVVRGAIGYKRPTELEIEVLAYMRGALVDTGARGSRASLIRIGERGIIGVAEGLSKEERRWAVAHELGHFEAHAGISFFGLCSKEDLVSVYESSGREPEANAFAAELLMPDDLFAKDCDIAKLSWWPIRDLARAYQVSITAASLRFIDLTAERAAVVCARKGVIAWCST